MNNIYTDPRYSPAPPAEPGVYLCGGVPLAQPVLLGAMWGQPAGGCLWAARPTWSDNMASIQDVARRRPAVRHTRLGDLPGWRGATDHQSEGHPTEPGHHLMATP